MKYVEKHLHSLFCISCAVWSFSFGGLLFQTDLRFAYFWHIIGICGTFLYLIPAQIIVCRRFKIPNSPHYISAAVPLTGIILLLEEILLIFGVFLGIAGSASCAFVIWISSATQVIALLIIHRTMYQLEHSQISTSTMSEVIYRSLAMPVLVYDSDKKLQILNDSARSFFDIDHDQTDIHTIAIQDLFDIDIDIFSFEGRQNDVDATCHNNQLHCNLSISKIENNSGNTTGYIILVTDLTEHMKAMSDLQDAIVEAQSANQAKSTFLANMSHEIRTPMNSIIGFSELILKSELSPEVREYTQDIKEASHNLLAIINDILDISKIESGKMKLVCSDYYMGTVFSDVSLIISNQAKDKGLAFVMNVDSSIPNKLYGDKIRIRSILINILNNAVKYTDKGTVTLDASIKQRNDDIITLEFKISDTGIGIKEEDQSTLFESFEQFDQQYHYGVEGSGLGLSIVKGYVTLMDGEITVDSVYGQGSTFTITVDQKVVDDAPMDRNFSQGENAANSNTIGNMKISGIRILVVDDNHVNLKVAKSTLSYYGLDVDTASDGFTAVDLCRKNHYPLVFLDHMMPDMDGVETMKQIRLLDPYYKHNGDSKLIVLTANAVSGIRDHLLQEGFDEYLGKPMNFKQLERLLSRFLPAECITYQAEDTNAPPKNTIPPEDFTYLKETLPEVDISFGIENCGGQLEDYLNVLEIAWNYGEKQLDELLELHQQQDYTNYTIKVHSMKSMTRNLGAIDISDLAKAQEDAGNNKEYTYIDAHKDELQTAYRSLLGKIQTVLFHYNHLTALDDTSKELLSEEAIPLILINIRQCIESFDFTKVFDILEEIQKSQLPEKYQDTFSKLGHLMDDLAIDEIQILLDEALKETSS